MPQWLMKGRTKILAEVLDVIVSDEGEDEKFSRRIRCYCI